PPPIMLTSQQRRNLFLVLKEALHNAVKHAGATEVRVAFHWSDGLHMRIQDDGCGATGTSAGGRGLGNMRKRMEEIGGRIAFDGTNGMRVEAVLPLAAP